MVHLQINMKFNSSDLKRMLAGRNGGTYKKTAEKQKPFSG